MNQLMLPIVSVLCLGAGLVAYFLLPDAPWRIWLAFATSALLLAAALFRTHRHYRQLETVQANTHIGLENGPFAILFARASGKPLFANEKIADLLGTTVKDILGSEGREGEFNLPDILYREITEQLKTGSDWTGEVFYPNAKPKGRVALTTVKPIFNKRKEITHVLTLAEDINDQSMFSRRMFIQANYDPSTGLPNRIRTLSRLELMVEKFQLSQGSFTTVFIDLDRTKLVNDSLGRNFVDKLFFDISQRLRREMGADDMLGHFGGDKFLMALANLRDEDAMRRVSAIKNLIKQPMLIENREVSVTASIGMATFPDDAKNAERLLHGAESAMYAAKGKGGDSISRYWPALDDYAVKRLDLENKLRYAIERNELELFFQPVINLENNQLCAAEVLLRWNESSTGDYIQPDDFISIAEETGLILSIGDWVLEQACIQALQWTQEDGEPLRIAINISARQFEHDHILHSVKRVLDETGLPPQLLELEITERLLINDDEDTRELMQRLKELGVKLSLDDFGTGYASLSYLKYYPFDVLKIDRAFVSDASRAEDSRQLTYAIIAMAHSLGMKVVAEGVEELEQRSILRERGCDMAQGYLFSPALPAKRFHNWAEQYRALNTPRNASSSASLSGTTLDP